MDDLMMYVFLKYNIMDLIRQLCSGKAAIQRSIGTHEEHLRWFAVAKTQLY